jgi:murein DD-endopeptidase MepM/ murein hydrolase activator NlpD
MVKIICYTFLLLYSTLGLSTPVSKKLVLLPTEGFVSSGYGYRTSPFTNKPAFHEGYDIVAPVGTPVYSPLSGKITAIGYDGGYGRYVMMNYSKKNLSALYGHLKKIYVKEGQIVRKGALLATVGTSGRSTGPHLHYEVRYYGKLINPRKYIKSKRVGTLISKRG